MANTLDPYGLDTLATAPASTALSVGGQAIVGVGTVVVKASQLASKLGPAAGALLSLLRTFGRGAIIRWSALPSWARQILIWTGISQGLDLLFDDDGTGLDSGLVPMPFGDAGSVGGSQVVGEWTANGIKFYRLADGRFAVRNSKGRWKVWRAPKPIMLTSRGAGNLRTFVQADKALDRQAKAINSAVGRRVRPATPRCSKCNYVHCRCPK